MTPEPTHVGLDDMADKIQKQGWTDFDVRDRNTRRYGRCRSFGSGSRSSWSHAESKSGTVTMDLASAIAEVKAGKIDFRVDKAGILHTAIGKSSFTAEQLKDNADSFLREILRCVLHPPKERMCARSLFLRPWPRHHHGSQRSARIAPLTVPSEPPARAQSNVTSWQ